MLNKCNDCGKRLRGKTLCLDTKKHVCKKCCELISEGCHYHYFCWTNVA